MNKATAFVLVLGSIAIVGGTPYAYRAVFAEKPKVARAPTAAELRAKEGPYIASTKKLSENEELSVVVVPSRFGAVLDTRCLIYRNREFKQVIFSCPDATARDLGED